jgi:hypothetical protein
MEFFCHRQHCQRFEQKQIGQLKTFLHGLLVQRFLQHHNKLHVENQQLVLNIFRSPESNALSTGFTAAALTLIKTLFVVSNPLWIGDGGFFQLIDFTIF